MFIGNYNRTRNVILSGAKHPATSTTSKVNSRRQIFDHSQRKPAVEMARSSWMFRVAQHDTSDAEIGRVEYSAQLDSSTIFLFRIGLRCGNPTDYGGGHENVNENVHSCLRTPVFS